MPATRKVHTSRFAVSPLSLTITAQTGRQFAPYLRRHLRHAHALLKSPLRELSLALVGNTTMSNLHHRYMNLKMPTDVLTFPIDFDPRGQPTSAEIYLCLPYAREQARQRNIPLKNELLLYALHGMLHLSGYDDRTHADFQKMHLKEDQILRRLKIGNVFAPPTPHHRSNAQGTCSLGSVPSSRRKSRRAP